MFGNRLKELRTSKKISQNELAKLLELSPNSLYNWEVGRSQPPVEAITKIANYFNVSTDYLLGFTQEDRDNMENLKLALKEAGMLNGEDDDMTKEDFEKALDIIRVLKERKKGKD